MPVYPSLENDYPFKLKPAIVRWVVPGWYAGGISTAGVTTGRMYYQPIFVEEPTTYIRIAIEVTAAGGAGSLARLGIYNFSDGLPGSLVLDAGTVVTDAIAIVEIVIAQTLMRGYYFTAFVCDSNPTCRNLNSGTCSPPVAGQILIAGGPVQNIIPCIDGQAGQVAAGLSDPAITPNLMVDPTWGASVWMREH